MEAAEGQIEDPSILKQVTPAGQVKGAVETLSDGKTIFYLFENADASTILHEAAHILRGSVLDDTDMGYITDWIRRQGVNVTHQYGEFVGDPAEVEKAEELFAKAFENYALEGRPPPAAPYLERAFQVLRNALANLYSAANDPVIGVPMDPEVRKVFDRMFEGMSQKANPTLMERLRRDILGAPEPGVEGVIVRLAREAKRKGIPNASLEDLAKQFDDAKAAGTPANQVHISFPVKVGGKKEWTALDLTQAQNAAEEAYAIRKGNRAGIRLDLTGRGKGTAASMITEEKAVEALRSLVTPVEGEEGLPRALRTTARVIVSAFFGGDLLSDEGQEALRYAPPEYRAVLLRAERTVLQSVGDTISMVNGAVDTGDDTELIRFLTGSERVARRSGRPVLSAGHNYSGSVLRMFDNMFETLSDVQKAALEKMADAINSADPDAALATFGFGTDGTTFKISDAMRQAVQDAAGAAIAKTLNATAQQNKVDFGSTLAGALRNAVQASPTPRPSHELKLMETLLYVTKRTQRNGRLFSGTDADATRILLGDIAKIYDDESSRRVAVLIGGFGGADRAKHMLVGINLGISPEAERNFRSWIVGGSVDPKYLPEIQRVVNRYGFNPEFVADPVLGVDFYIPSMARDRMANSLARVNFRDPTALSARVSDAFNAIYRYMKLRMTRGSLITIPRYFMTNTADHAAALGTVVGFGVAAASTTRLIGQNVVTITGLGTGLELARIMSGGRIKPDVIEKVRRGLQAGGDRAAWMVGQLFSTGKYRIEVNPILEGANGTFRVGGNVYSFRDVRNTAVEEGIFSSFDSSQLAALITKEGRLSMANANLIGQGTITFGKSNSTVTARLRNFFGELSESASDMAEAWGERERLGAMVTLMEAGYDPRTAARLVIDALYDYSQSMSKADRSWLVGVLFPFWAFQKNANMQVFNLIFSPAGAYRAMVIKRAKERFADLLSEVLYNDVGSEYGLDVKSMPPELQDTYYSIVTSFYDAYNGDPPEDAKRALRLLMTGRAVGVEGGKYFEVAHRLMTQRGAGGFADLQKFGEYISLRPEKSARMSSFRDRTGVAVPFPRTEAVRTVMGLLGDNYTYMEIYWPESAFEAGMKYHTQVMAGMLLLGAKGIDLVAPVGSLTEGGIEGVNLANVLEPVVSLERSPILGPVLPAITAGSMEPVAPPKRVAKPLVSAADAVMELHPAVAKLLSDSYGTTFVRVPAEKDPFLVDVDGKLPQLSPEEVERIRRLNDEVPGIGVRRDERIYMLGGVMSTALYNSPLGEINTLLLRWEQEPLERANIRGDILRVARAAGGFDVSVVSASKTMRSEEPTKLKETKKF